MYITLDGKKQRAIRTLQFVIENVGFFEKGLIMPRSGILSTLLTADLCTLTFFSFEKTEPRRKNTSKIKNTPTVAVVLNLRRGLRKIGANDKGDR